VNGKTFLKAGDIFEGRTNAGVVQDNIPPRRFAAASPEPLAAEHQAVTATQEPLPVIPSADYRPTHHGSETRQTEQIQGRVPPHIKSEIQRIANLKGWTESYTVRTLVEQALARTIAEQFGVMIRQTIQGTVRQEFQIYTNKMGKLNFNAYLAAEQGRLLGIENYRANLGQQEIGSLSGKIKSIRQQALDNLKFYNYSLKDVEEAATETVPWQ
jgi:hypothetical protein